MATAETHDLDPPPPEVRRKSKSAARFMDAAEDLFLELGYDGASVRAVAARAKASLGTLVYHWGSKENLFREVCLRRFGAIRAEQLARLRACETGWRRPLQSNIEPILRALVEPPMLAFGDDPAAAQTTRKLYGIALTDPSPASLRVSAEIFSEAGDLYCELLRRTLPHLDEKTFFWRYTCALGAFVFAQSFSHRVAYATHFDELSMNWAAAAEEIVASMHATLVNP
jgi:AcrR family transcriptional regulator